MADYVKKTDEGLATQMETMARVLPGYLAVLGIAANDPVVVQQAKDAPYFRAMLNMQATVQAFAQGWTNWKKYQRDGGTAVVTTPPMPTLPADFPDDVPPGIVPRYRATVKYIKARPTCTPAILEALGVDKQDQAAPDLETIQPDFAVKIVGGQPFVDWGWLGFGRFLDQCELAVDRDDGKGEVFLAIDSTPGYADTCPRPATPTKWTYRAIFRVGDSRVGIWSKPVAVIVGG